MISSNQIKTYYNLAKPGIIYGNLLTAAAGYLFASHWQNHYINLVAMLIGLGLIIGSSCVLNNVIDKGLDIKMERTKKRATVTGKISDKSALIYATILAVLGIVILGIFTNRLAVFTSLFGMLIYIVFYGYAKRKTVYGTLVGSLAGAVPPLVGYTAYTNFIDLAGIMLLFVLICWQLAHFYGIALYRKKEYKAAGLPVWPIVKGDWSAQVQAIGSIALFSLFAISLFLFGYCGFIYIATVLVLGIGWLWYTVIHAGKLSAAVWGRKVFLSSLVVILVFSLAISFGPILP
ncbi:MAG: heme o synthase [Candidatus Saccharibacteria bacterium]